MKDEGRLSEAFVFLNHYLDLCEAIEEEEGQLVDHSDLLQTDFPSNIPLPHQLYLTEDQKEHDNIKEWVLAISMDQKIDQVYYEGSFSGHYKTIFKKTLVEYFRRCRSTIGSYSNLLCSQENRHVW